MPKDTKETAHHKFKAVTEELTSASPSTQETAKTQEPEVKETQNIEHEKPMLAVAETNNIDPTVKAHDGGVFFKFFLVTFFATLLALALAGGVYVYLTGVKGVTVKSLVGKATMEPIPTDAPTPTATPLANVDLSTFKVSVLNGNGGIGVATAAKTIIEKAGFKVGYIGNADNFNFTDTMIQVKAGVSADVVATLKTSLSSNYSVSIGDPLDSTSTYDIVVTVGSK